ncbi:MAG: ABC transporter ATP-binding protein [Paracoccus sp. (in: a-proteobacteria)]|uniref:ABC transporter ATP-binding protein n=1 Tax=Paracoccus sp. TaxID=267 RepID=UPI00391E00AC
MKHDTVLSVLSGAVLSGTGLSKRFGKGAKAVQILQDLDIALPRGALSLVKGPSGCGKSTLLAILAGLTAPDAGRVDALGQPLWALRPAARDAFRLRHMGFVFQGSILFPALRAHEQIELVLGHMGIPAALARARAMAALEDVGLGPRAHLRPDALSGGEKQRVAIACALAKQPQLIFADEPTSALDTENSDLVSRHLRRLATDHGVTVICVTHDDRLSPWADRIYHMRAGRIDRIQMKAP